MSVFLALHNGIFAFSDRAILFPRSVYRVFQCHFSTVSRFLFLCFM